MNSDPAIYHGVVRGKTIELDQATGLPDGQDVMVAIHPGAPGDGIRESAGGWGDAGPELDDWLRKLDQARHSGRSVTQP